MREKLLAVCDKDERYLQGIQEYFGKKGMADFSIVTFSSLSQAAGYSKNRRFEILLLGENVYDAAAAEIESEKTYLLWENGQAADKKYPVIAKYQAMGDIFAQVMEDYAADENCSGGSILTRHRTRLISFYSPDRADGQTAAALAAAEALASAGSRVLYLNLRAFAGFEELLHTEYEADITDYLYFVLQYADKALYKLESMKKTLGGLDYLAPALDYADLLQITKQQWEETMDILLENGSYEVIVLDLSEICQGFYPLLARSDKIILLSGSSGQAGAMYSQYCRLLEARGSGAIAEKTQNVRLPEHWERECTDYAHLAATRLGEQLRRQIQ